MDAHLQQHLSTLLSQHPNIIAEVRGEGLMLGLKLNVPAAAFIERARHNRLLVIAANENAVRLLPPLIVEETHLREAADALTRVCKSFETERKAV